MPNSSATYFVNTVWEILKNNFALEQFVSI